MIGIDKSYRRLLKNSADLCAFVVVCRTGSVTRAAAQLGISQPSLSKRIRNLEQAAGTVLLVRQSNGVVPTEVGARLLDAVASSFDAIALSFGRHVAKPVSESVLVSVDFAFATYWLLPRLPQLREEIGATDICILASQTPLLDSHDSSIRIFMSNAADMLPGDRPLFHERVFAVCSPKLLPEGRQVEDADQLLSIAPLLHLSTPRPAAPWMDWAEWLDLQGFETSGRLPGTEFNTYEMVVRSALEGQGIALGWQCLVDRYISSGELVPILPAVERKDILYVARVEPNFQTRTVEAVMSWIDSEVRKGVPAT